MASIGGNGALERLVFLKDTNQFGVWNDLIIGHLRQKSSALARDAMMKNRSRPAFKFEQLLVSRCEVPRPLDEDGKELMDDYEWQQCLLTEQDSCIWGLFNLTLPRNYMLSLQVSFNDESIPAAWNRLERAFGQSTAQGMVQLVNQFDQALSMDFASVGQLVQRVREARNRVVRQSQELIDEKLELIPDELAAFKVLSLFPSQYWGNQVNVREKITLDKVEVLLRNVFMDKSRGQIESMQAKSVPVNMMRASKNLGKRKERQGVKGQQGECFYCDGKYNVNEEPHRKIYCPKMLEDRAHGTMRSNIFVKGKRVDVKSVGVAHVKGAEQGAKKKAKRVEIPVDVVLLEPAKVKTVVAAQTAQQETGTVRHDMLSSEQVQADLDTLMTSPAASPAGSDANMSEVDDVSDFGIPVNTGVITEASSNIEEASMAIEKEAADTA